MLLHKNKKIIFVIVVLIIVSLGVYFLLIKPQISTNAGVLEDKKPLTFHKYTPPGMQEYINNLYNISLIYSRNLSVFETYEPGNVATIVFENKNTVKGFQIFVTPYSEKQISKERFLQDVPSGIRSDERSLLIGSNRCSAFYSQDVGIGDTFEVWCLNNGYLFEITTTKALESEMLETIKTLVFL